MHADELIEHLLGGARAMTWNPQSIDIKLIKKVVDAALRNRVSYRIGKIEAVEADGTYSVSIIGQTGNPMLGVPDLSGNTGWIEGQEVTLHFVEGDPNRPQIIGKAGYTSRNL